LCDDSITAENTKRSKFKRPWETKMVTFPIQPAKLIFGIFHACAVHGDINKFVFKGFFLFFFLVLALDF